MKYLINEDFKKYKLGYLEYDLGHSALGEYHFQKFNQIENFYDPICLHKWRSEDGSWLITEDLGCHFLENSRKSIDDGPFKETYLTLVYDNNIPSTYGITFDIRLMELNTGYSGVAVCYNTSRDYIGIGINQDGIAIFKRIDDDILILSEKKMEIDDFKTYHFKVSVGSFIYVYLDDILQIKAQIDFKYSGKFALVSKTLSRYEKVTIFMTDFEYKDYLKAKKEETKDLDLKQAKYPKMELIHKIELKYGSGRQLRIKRYNDEVYFVIAQHEKRVKRDAFASISSLKCFKLDGTILWQIGEDQENIDFGAISCDLPFQVWDIDNDSKLEVVYYKNFEVHIIDLLTGVEKNKFKTPIIKGDPNVKDNPFYRLNVDQIIAADFEGLGYLGDMIIKDRYQNAWAIDKNFNILFRYHNKNTGHFPLIYDFNNDGKTEMFIGYDLVSASGDIIMDLPFNSDHTDEIIYKPLKEGQDAKLILASGNEGFNIFNIDGTLYKHHNIGHAQRETLIDINDKRYIFATSFWGGANIVSVFDSNGDKIKSREFNTNGILIEPLNYDGIHNLLLTNSSEFGGLIDENLDTVVNFPADNHPTLTSFVFDIDNDGIDEIITLDMNNLYIYKSSKIYKNDNQYIKSQGPMFSNYKGEYLLKK